MVVWGVKEKLKMMVLKIITARLIDSTLRILTSKWL